MPSDAQGTGTFELIYSKSKKELRTGNNTLNDANRFEQTSGGSTLSDEYDGYGSGSGSGSGSYSASSRGGGAAVGGGGGGGTMELIKEVEEEQTGAIAVAEAKVDETDGTPATVVESDLMPKTMQRPPSKRTSEKLRKWAGNCLSRSISLPL